MLTSLLVAGFGGQGVMTIGKLIGECAYMQGLRATYYPSYGPEQRGGTANCTVMLSDKEIGSPLTSEPDVLMAMNQPSLDKFMASVKPGGIIMTNSTLVDTSTVTRSDVKLLPVAADDLAYEIGSNKVANIIMIAAYMEATKAMPADEAKKLVLHKMAKKPEFAEMNEKAFEAGREAVQNSI